MTTDGNAGATREPAAVLLGYLNFSSGAFDPAAWRALDALFAGLEPATPSGVVEGPDTAAAVAALLGRRLDELAAGSAAFRDAGQARAALGLLFDQLLPAYRAFHADLLEHQPPGAVERPWFVMAAAQAVLAEFAAGDGVAVARSLDRLNDYVGWRPVAVLENGRLSEPYRHERVRPVPLFVAGAGAAHGRYGDLVDTAIGILASAPPDLLRQADFDPDALEELAIDPRAFDFLHPAASRPNYLFGLWDPARIDAQGRYRRMVVQQATLDGILSWPARAAADVPGGADLDAEFRLEAAAVLAGVVLMASGLSGHGPGARQAALPLAELLPRIAGYRDEFYRWLLGTLTPRHRARLEQEAARQRQPFGGVRRHINATLAGRRARQVEHVALAAVCARLGRAAAAERHAGAVPAASARLFARLTSRVVAAQGALRRGAEQAAARELDVASDLLFRAVECGAAVDPWSILGLSGQFPLHEPGGESMPDPRVDDLVHAVDSILSGYAAVRRQAALGGVRDAATHAAAALERLAAWWDRFATTTVSGVPHLSGREVAASAAEVISALERRRASAPAAPPLGFWRREVASFTTPRSHAQAAEALLREGDLDGALGLLVHWASLLEGDAIGRTGSVWLAAATRWLDLASADPDAASRARVRRFLELVEANTSAVVDVVESAAAGGGAARDRAAEAGADDEHPGGAESVAAAYESMVWRDSADDGVDGGMIDVDLPGGGQAEGPAALEDAAELIAGTLGLMRSAVTAWCAMDAATGVAPDRAELDSVVGWRHSLRRLRRALVRAATTVAGRDAEPPPGMPPTEFDRLRWQRDAAAERLIDAALEAGETLWILSARLHVGRTRPAGRRAGGRGAVGRLFAALFAGDAAAAAPELETVRGRLVDKPVLYVPLSRGGRPDRIVAARGRERLLARVAASLPRAGLVSETIALVQFAKALESLRPPGAASVSEFDRVFEAATAALVERIVESAGAPAADAPTVTGRILEGLALLVPRLLETWLTHARQLRLSVLERVRDERAFAITREFVEHYGSGLFTQHLLAPATLRGILRGGVRGWLDQLVERVGGEPGDGDGDGDGERRPAALRPARLVEDLSSGAIGFRQAAARLRLVLEAVAENHAEYRDWNSTTTQSDRGECLHILLDFLRVKAEHDRISWTLKPVNVAHRALARRGAVEAAEAWRGRMRDETRETAEGLAERLARLEAHWGLKLASIGDRVRRPFTAALEQDELESLVEPAVRELVGGESGAAGDRLEARAESFLGVASGSGVEVPEWLERLSTTVDAALDRAASGGFDPGARPDRGRLPHALPWVALPWDALHAALAR